MTLPLRLTPFERYMLSDDRPLHPMTHISRLVLSGSFVPECFEEAIAKAVQRHPLLRARVRGRTPWSVQWVPAPDPRPYVSYGDASVPFQFPGSALIDLRRENGLRIWVRTGADRTEVRLQIHHACSDGLGAVQFMEDLLCGYEVSAHPQRENDVFRPLDLQMLRKRGRIELERPTWPKRIYQDSVGTLLRVSNFLFRRPMPLCSVHVPALEDIDLSTLPEPPIHVFEKSESTRLRTLAFELGISVQQLLLRELFVVISRWNQQRDGTSRGRLMRLMIPVAFRNPKESAIPACNVVSMVSIDGRIHSETELAPLQESISRQLRFIHSWRLGLAFLRFCRAFGVLPGGLRLLTGANRCYATAVSSYFGNVFSHTRLPRVHGKLRAGDLVLEELRASVPVRRHTAAAFCYCYYAKRLHVTMAYDRHHLSADEARELGECMIDRLRSITAPASQAVLQQEVAAE